MSIYSRNPSVEELNVKINKLLEEKDKLCNTLKKDYQEQVRKYVGKCYKYTKKEVYFKIINVPQTVMTSTGPFFNEYRFPAVFLDGAEDVPFYIDNVYLDPLIGIPEKYSNPKMGEQVEEITSATFDLVFRTCSEFWTNDMLGRGKD